MPLVVGTNSYVSVAEADIYFLELVGGDFWEALTTEEKESALLSAMPILEAYCKWTGTKTDPEQPLEWPRNGMTEVPKDIKDGQCQIASSVWQSGSVQETTSAAIKKLKADTVELEYMDNFIKTNSIYTSYLAMLLNPYCVAGTIGTGSASGRVVRV